MPEVVGSTTVAANPDSAFDWALTYLSHIGYTVVESARPSRIELERGSSWLNSSWDKRPVRLTVTLEQLGNTTLVRFVHKVSPVMWVGDEQGNSASEVLAFGDFARAQAAATQPSPIERQVIVRVKCQYCGTLNDQEASKCTSCGASI